MNPLAQLLAEIRRRGLELAPGDDGTILVRPRSRLDDELRAAIRRHKPELLRLLRGRSAPLELLDAAAALAAGDDGPARDLLAAVGVFPSPGVFADLLALAADRPGTLRRLEELLGMAAAQDSRAANAAAPAPPRAGDARRAS